MSTWGLEITNPSGKLVISSDAMGLCCIGRATLVQVVQPTGSAAGAAPGRVCGYSVYRISSASPIIVAVDLPTGRRVSIVSVTQPSSGLWEITVVCGDTPDADGFDTQYEVAVWAYGFAPAILGTWGLAMWDKNGNLSWDLTRNPLFPRAFITGDNTGAKTIPSLLRPVAIGFPGTDIVSANNVGGVTRYVMLRQSGCWVRTGTSLLDTLYTREQYILITADPNSVPAYSNVYSTPSFIIEGALLP